MFRPRQDPPKMGFLGQDASGPLRWAPRRPRRDKTRAVGRQIFRAADADDSGDLDREELRIALRPSGEYAALVSRVSRVLRVRVKLEDRPPAVKRKSGSSQPDAGKKKGW